MEDNKAEQEKVTGSGLKLMYLIEDVVGPYSRIVYGKAGDEIKVLDDKSEMILVEGQGQRFYTRMKNLQDLPVPMETVLEVPAVKPAVVSPMRTQNNNRPAIKKSQDKPNNQTQLF
jgi:hypothetical protein